MSFNANLPLSPRDEVRLLVGDIDPENPIMPDSVYEHLLFRNDGNVRTSAIGAARTALLYLARFTRERAGQIEVYGAEWATNYRKGLELFLKNASLNDLRPVPYCGGISVADMEANRANPDNVPFIGSGFVSVSAESNPKNLSF